MNRERAKELLPIITAFAEEKKIRFKSKDPTDQAWMTLRDVVMWEDGNIYEVLPEPKLRPWKPEEVPVGALVKCPDESWRAAITEVDSAAFYAGVDRKWYLNDKQAMPLYSVDGGVTWKSCGVVE